MRRHSSHDDPQQPVRLGQIDAYAAVHFGPDADLDGIADPCDCAPADPGSYDAPGEAGPLDVLDAATVLWGSMSHAAGPGTVYDLVRGAVSDLRSSGSIATAACVAAGTAATSFTETLTPAAGDGYYYVVRARNACGSGGWGQTSAGAPRSHADCP